MIPHMPHLTLPASSSSMNPSVPPMLRLDLAGCNADDLYIWLLYTMWQNDTEYAVMPLALQLRIEDIQKLWKNTTYVTWKVGAPGQDIGLVMTVVTICCKEYKTKRMVIDTSDEAIIQYPVSNLDDDDGEDDVEDGDDPMQDMLAGGEGEDNSDDNDYVDDDIQ